ncbi:uncharacterized protein LOC129618916 [Condylostylus longicornis]|uniref:uncharacterized protein LOC129618916 n=1 Tax=Condylostylus longicornis TaxID=2530218 RepID=UPI00244E0937|nr:uncharacterized protein LOC129618916 [Condylostylus longicornis]
MDKIIESIDNSSWGYQIGDNNIKIICYADDAVLLAENEDNLQRLLYRVTKTAERYNMEISTEKTKSMTVSKDPVRCKLSINNHIIEQVFNFKYLGVNITSSRGNETETCAQAGKAAAISGYLRDVIWKNKYMLIENKVRIYKTCIRPILTYAAETRADTSKTKQRLRTTEMQTLRQICNYSLRDKKRSSDIRNMCGVQDIVRWTRSRRRNWRDHVHRMNENRLAKIAMTGQLTSKRPTGRPPKRWRECWTSQSQDQTERG